jgi:hypothetical protein
LLVTRARGTAVECLLSSAVAQVRKVAFMAASVTVTYYAPGPAIGASRVSIQNCVSVITLLSGVSREVPSPWRWGAGSWAPSTTTG